MKKKKNRRDFLKDGFIKGAMVFLGIRPLDLIVDTNFSSNQLKHSNGAIDWEYVKSQYIFEQDRSYFNFGSLGLTPKPVIDKYFSRLVSLEQRGTYGYKSFDILRNKLANFLNVNSNEIGITRNTTEGMNICARGLDLKSGDEVVISSDEHIGGSACWLQLQKEKMIKLKVVDLDHSGEKNLEIIKSAVTENTKVLSISHVTSATGTILPIEKILTHCRKLNVISVIDGAQAIGMIPVNLGRLSPDFYCGSGHKWLGGPKETGFIYVNSHSSAQLKPIFVGAYSDDAFNLSNLEFKVKSTISRIEYGTRNMSLATGLSAAINFISEIGIENISSRGKELAKYFLERISQHQKITVISPKNNKFCSSIVSFTIENKDSSRLSQKLLMQHKIAVRSVHENDLNALRVSFSIQNDYKEIDKLLKIILEEASK